MTKLIAKTRTATTEQLLEMAGLLNDATTREASMVRAAVTVVLEERLTAAEFDLFFAELDAA
jgi:hypothetical protein